MEHDEGQCLDFAQIQENSVHDIVFAICYATFGL